VTKKNEAKDRKGLSERGRRTPTLPELKTTSFGAQSNPCDFLVDNFLRTPENDSWFGFRGLADE